MGNTNIAMTFEKFKNIITIYEAKYNFNTTKKSSGKIRDYYKVYPSIIVNTKYV